MHTHALPHTCLAVEEEAAVRHTHKTHKTTHTHTHTHTHKTHTNTHTHTHTHIHTYTHTTAIPVQVDEAEPGARLHSAGRSRSLCACAVLPGWKMPLWRRRLVRRKLACSSSSCSWKRLAGPPSPRSRAAMSSRARSCSERWHRLRRLPPQSCSASQNIQLWPAETAPPAPPQGSCPDGGV